MIYSVSTFTCYIQFSECIFFLFGATGSSAIQIILDLLAAIVPLAPIASAIAALLTVIYAAKSISEAIKDRQLARNVIKQERLSRYYEQTVVGPTFRSIKEFRAQAEDVFGGFARKVESHQINEVDLRREVEEAREAFEPPYYEMRRKIRGAVTGWQDNALLDEVVDNVDRIQKECFDSVVDETVITKDGVRIPSWQDPLLETTGELMRIIRRSDPLLQSSLDTKPSSRTVTGSQSESST